MSSTPPRGGWSSLLMRFFPENWHGLIQNTLWLYLVQISGYLLPFLTLPYLARVLSVEHFGQIAYAQIITWNFVTLTEYGFNLTATRDVSVQRHEPERLSAIFNAVMAAKLLLTLVGLVILLGLTALVPHFRDLRPLLLMSFGSVLGYALFPTWLFQGLELMRHVALRDLTAKSITVILLFALVRSDADFLWAAAVQSAGLALAGLVGICWVPRLTPVRFARPAWSEIMLALRTGWPPFLFGGISALSYSLAVTLVEWKGLTAEIGYFNAAQRITSVFRTLPGVIATALFSRLSYQAAQDEQALVRFVDKYWKIFAAPFLVLAVIVTLAAPWGTPLFLGEKYVPSIVPLQILSWGPLFLSWGHFYSTYYMLPRRHDQAWMRLAIGCSVIGNLCLLPALWFTRGATAMALSLTFTEFLAVCAYGHFYYTHTREFRRK